MKIKHSALPLIMAAMIASSCNNATKTPSHDDMLNAIDSIEASINVEFPETIDTAISNGLINKYVQFADAYPNDSLTPSFLLQAARWAYATNNVDDMVKYYDRIIDNYEGYEKLDECMYEKGLNLDNAGRKEEARKAYQEFIDDETVMASKRSDNTIVKRCEPFDFSKLVPYSPQVVAGFIAERYSIGLKEGWGIAQESIKKQLRNHMDQYIRRNWRCDRVDSLRFSTLYSNITYKYLLVPVWISSFKYNDKVYQFVVNGQTGKVGGRAPVSALRVLAAIGIGLLIIGLLLHFT